MSRVILSAALVAQLASVASAQELSPSHASPPPVRSAPREVARVNGVVLTSDRLAAAVNALVPQESFHRSVSSTAMTALRGRALQQLVDEELQYQDGERLGIKVREQDIDTAYAATVKRYGGAAAFTQALGRAGASRASVRKEIRRALVIERIRGRRVTATCQVGDAEAARYFGEHPERFVEPEQLHVFAITLGVDPSSTQTQWAAAKARADALRTQLVMGASFSALARQHSTDASRTQGGDMGFMHRGSLAPAFESAAKELPVGQVSDVIETLYGYHLVRISEVRPARRMVFTEISTTLKSDLSETRCKEVEHAWISHLRSSATIAIAG